MKKLSLFVVLTMSVVVGTSAVNPAPCAIERIIPATGTCNVRVTLVRSDGTPVTTGSVDLSDFYARSPSTGEYYYAEYNMVGGFFQLPAKIYDLPAGTYTFGADRGQGNWIAVREKVVTITPDMAAADGFINVVLEIAWEE
ncbi:MAG TPA: hypothetical protein VM802_20025 [Chitinophaga sp.]|uniref:hypothetical protein n=1 Tax=Chitinophaga sp. TaxID=1869181 RepID=UPI002C5673E5|nr:hypothetical protein [Chitinophaga sp.]HVI47176.1 hypothetical protein [Chitinophaga sp.]